MALSKTQSILSIVLQLIVAAILFQTLFFKFTGAVLHKFCPHGDLSNGKRGKRRRDPLQARLKGAYASQSHRKVKQPCLRSKPGSEGFI